jgi:hypothetical protein
MMSKISAAIYAIEKAGGNRKLANKLKPAAKKIEIERLEQAISKWRKNGIPSKWAIKVEKITGVSYEELCPSMVA